MTKKPSILERLLDKFAPIPPTKRRKNQPPPLQPDNINRIGLTISNLKEAVDAAEDAYNPTRNDLQLLYKQARKDSHVESQFTIAVNKVQSVPYIIWQGDTENDDLKYYFKRPWFDGYLEGLIDAELMGYTLLELGDLVNGEFVKCSVFPRRYVIADRREMITHPAMLRGAPYDDAVLEGFHMLEAGDPADLGTMQLITLEVIYKNFSRADWSDFNERYGKPILDIATDTSDDQETMKKVAMASSFGSNLYIVRDFDDQVNILEAKSTSSNAANFERSMRMSDEYISKVINGQSGTSDEKAFVGSAEVGERILNDYTKARLRRISNHINYSLIPLMVKLGYPLADCTFEFVIEEKRDDTNATQEPVNRLVAQKKKTELIFSPDLQPVAASALDSWLRRYFEGTVQGVDKTMWQFTLRRLLRALSDVGMSYEATYQYADLARTLRHDAAVFAAFKNHDEQQALAKLLVGADGKPVNWQTFRKAAAPLTEKYNREWLLTEYSQAQASAQMAVKWEGFQEAKDLYPNLRYDAVMDEFTRDDHAALDGTVLPIDDPFWNRNYPPNGWGCRCTVTQTDKPATRKPDFKPDAGFRFNPGKDRKLFDDKTYKDVDEATALNIRASAETLLNDYLDEQR